MEPRPILMLQTISSSSYECLFIYNVSLHTFIVLKRRCLERSDGEDKKSVRYSSPYLNSNHFSEELSILVFDLEKNNILVSLYIEMYKNCMMISKSSKRSSIESKRAISPKSSVKGNNHEMNGSMVKYTTHVTIARDTSQIRRIIGGLP